jgi:polyphosphate kinase 2
MAKSKNGQNKKAKENGPAAGAGLAPSEPEGAKGKLTPEAYEKALRSLQIELVKLQAWVQHKGLRVVVLFEGRDAAGKGGVIKRITEHLNPRHCRIVALPKPTERESTQWYFHRYVAHLPTAGEIVLFDRSWYNRAGVERVMGFCTPEEYQEFLRACPQFERMLIRSGIILIKYYFSISPTEQCRRFERRIKDPLRRWKLSTIDFESRARQGRRVRAHRHAGLSVARGGGGLQEAGAAQLHRPPAQPDSLRGRPAQGGHAPAAAGGLRVRAPAAVDLQARAGGLLEAVSGQPSAFSRKEQAPGAS